MLQHLLNENNLWSLFKDYGLDDVDMIFINELINRPPAELSVEWMCNGRPVEKSFLYEVIKSFILFVLYYRMLLDCS